MFLPNLKEHDVKYTDLSTYAPWGAMIAPGIIKNDDESYMQTFRFRGKDLASSTPEELVVMMSRINAAFKLLGTGWAIYFEARRSKITTTIRRDFPDPVCQLMDYERQNMFSNGTYFVMDYYFTLQWLPPSSKKSRLLKFAYVNDSECDKSYLARCFDELQSFRNTVNHFYDAMQSVLYDCEPLSPEDTLTYLHSTVSIYDFKVGMTAFPIHINDILCDTEFYGGDEPVIGRKGESKHLACLSITGYPESSFPGILDELNHLDIEYRWVSRYIFQDKEDAQSLFYGKRREWKANEKDLLTMVKEWITRTDSVMVDSAALQRFADADQALVEIANGYCGFGYFTSSIVLMDETKKGLEEKIRSVQRAYHNVGFVCRTETHNATEAFLACIPGNAYANPRRAYVSTLNLCHMLPFSAVWAGEPWCKHLNSHALAQVETIGFTPFFLNLHIGDVGHSIVVGPTGSGKSVFLNFMETQIRSVPNARIYVFDKGGSSRVLAAMVQGEFFDLGNENRSDGQSFQPLRYIDDENEKIWASEWLQELFVQENITITPEVKSDIWDALDSVANSVPDHRTLSSVLIYLQNRELKKALEPYVLQTVGISDTAGAYGRLFDSDKDTLKLGNYQSFEMGELMNKRNAVVPTLSYLFHRIENDCHGEPTFIILDECWTFLDNPIFAGKIREWLKTMRKNNVSIVFATQNLEDIRKCSISSAIIESCGTRIFLPNVQAMNSSNDEVYGFFDLNYTERTLIANSTPKRDYYYASVQGRRVFSLALSPYALSFIGASTKEDQSQCEYIKKNFPAEEFPVQWLRFKGQEEAIKAYEDYLADPDGYGRSDDEKNV